MLYGLWPPEFHIRSALNYNIYMNLVLIFNEILNACIDDSIEAYTIFELSERSQVWLTELRLIPEARLWLDSSLLNFWSKEKDGWLDPTEFKLLRLPTPGIFSRAARISSPSTVLSLLSTIFPLEWGTVFSGEPDSPDVWP